MRRTRSSSATTGPCGPARRTTPAAERSALRAVRGRVLDVGCGAGRVSLHLQGRGLEVVAVDASPGAVEVARRRGVRDARVMDLTDLGPGLGRFERSCCCATTSG